MKKLFTLCACACLAFTLSAQDSEHAAGSYYLGTGDATSLVNIFSSLSEVSISPTVGYAVIDDLVVTGSINGATDDPSGITVTMIPSSSSIAVRSSIIT